ncbi:hypoxanthine-guanine phosphoribosyltransferase [Coemansia thaxteri]|uniref:Hypoxanthine-guanine phosphoribosyltransferase n=1 Tax=Coemansia thaxteri TaxID=2663907 RepID=A0A9W8EIJ2_9FUNG|nr:hypoxanthine-guanine phosphoribosyltransferase [Coemansia thaxteri]KAJ2007362.1 hypoxanthine-guanine phosphoribosyltransferase [Coemansia thaxteri]KAJ2469227.1 hypoxanthine-guanine phosphoribosyltransferase [Coemansia sp. RSA 2322]KAJ2478568.1 hypoxanthine-guanine phosphoribosyltransferase [Coemansia sp. RSA 2320]
MAADGKLHISYNQIHQLIEGSVRQFGLGDDGFSPDLIVAIGGGGFIPARILRSFLKAKHGRNVPIQAVGLTLYEELPGGAGEAAGAHVTKTQWLDFGSPTRVALLGRRILVVDEVDDSRKTLAYAVAELRSDVEAQERLAGMAPGASATEIGVFVVYNKDKPKAEPLPPPVMRRYFAAATTPDRWLAFPWDCTSDIAAHTALAEQP